MIIYIISHFEQKVKCYYLAIKNLLDKGPLEVTI
jgi:hypothetical protein